MECRRSGRSRVSNLLIILFLSFSVHAENLARPPHTEFSSQNRSADPVNQLYEEPCGGHFTTGCRRYRSSAWRGDDGSRLPRAQCPECSPGDRRCQACLPMRKHKPSCIIIHHSGVKNNDKIKNPIESVQALHKDATQVIEISKDPNGRIKDKLWGDVPYHFLIDKYGNLIEGRHPIFAPDTNTGDDTCGRINVEISGDFTNGKDQFSSKQEQLTRKVVAALKQKYGIAKVVAHRSLPNTKKDTVCPGDDVMRAFAAILSPTCPPAQCLQ